MPHDLSIDPITGALTITGLAVALSAGQAKAEIVSLLASCARGGRDYRNGYAWLNFGGLAFGGAACDLALCFFEERLVEVSWNVALPDAEMEDGWPSRQASEDAVRFVRQVLTTQLERSPDAGAFSWGRVWSQFDPKAGLAAHGLRYTGSPQHR